MVRIFFVKFPFHNTSFMHSMYYAVLMKNVNLYFIFIYIYILYGRQVEGGQEEVQGQEG